jgi:hypothetical protein
MLDEQTRIVMEQVAAAAARAAVKDALTALGIDPNNPLEAQRDMAALRELRDTVTDEEYQRDMLHLRRWRKAMDGVQDKGTLTAVGIVTSGAIAALWLGIKTLISSGN